MAPDVPASIRSHRERAGLVDQHRMNRDRRVGQRGKLLAVVIGYSLEQMVHAGNDPELRLLIAFLEVVGVFNRYLPIGGSLHNEDRNRDLGDLFRRVVAEPGDQIRLDARAKEAPARGIP